MKTPPQRANVGAFFAALILSAGAQSTDPALLNTYGDGIDTPEERVAFKTKVELENVDNTSDADKPLSTAATAAIDGSEPGSISGLAVKSVHPVAPKTIGKLMNLNRGATTGNRNWVSIFTTGDSLGNRVCDQLRFIMGKHYPSVGYGFEYLNHKTLTGTITAPGTNSTPNFEPARWDTGRVWDMTSGSELGIGIPLSGTDIQPIKMDEVSVIFSKQAGGGTADIYFSTDYPTGSATWTLINSVSTAGTDGDPATGTFDIGNPRFAVIKIVANGGPLKFVGSQLLDSTAQGIVWGKSNNGGLAISTANTGNDTLRNSVGAIIDPDLVVVQFDDGIGTVTQADIDEYLDNYITACPDADFLVYKHHRTDPSDTTEDHTFWETAASTRFGVSVLDLEDIIGGLQFAYAAGFRDPATGLPDVPGNIGIHMTDNGYKFVASDLLGRIAPESQTARGFAKYYFSGSDERYILADDRAYNEGIDTFYDFPGHRDDDMNIRLTWNRANGFDGYWMLKRFDANDANAPLGLRLEFQGDGSALSPISIDEAGRIFIASTYSVAFEDATASNTRLWVEENSAASTVMTLRHDSAAATTILEARDSTNTAVAKITKSGAINAAAGFAQGATGTGPTWTSGAGSPEGVVSAPVGSFFSRTDGGAGTSWYVKESGTGNTGWVAK